MAFVKLDAGILDSTLWLEDAVTCKIFITMLAMCDQSGLCPATAPGIARRANVPLEEARRAIMILESPDTDSRSMDEDGRRVMRVDGGYQIINYVKFRNKDHTAAARKRRQREREQNQRSTTESRRDNVTVTHAEAETKAEAKSSETKVSGASAPLADPDPVFGVALRFLLRKGIKEANARSYLGLMRKKHGDALVIEVATKAEQEDVSEPLAWMRKALEARATGGNPKPAKLERALNSIRRTHDALRGNQQGDADDAHVLRLTDR